MPTRRLTTRASPIVSRRSSTPDPIKWIMNTWEGLPGFVTVNMATQDTQLVRLPEGHYMHISTGEHFNNYLYRYVRFQFPFEIFGEAAFELNDEGEPYWIVPTVKMRIGLFGGEDYDGAILVNACTGETTKYDLADVPNWCDKVFTADLVYEQLGYYGKYRSGFINSLIGQTGVLVPTGSPAPGLFNNDSSSSSGVGGGYNYLVINDDVYMYTGMTSANSDESLVGFALVNLRTKEPRYYTCAGATESSAMSSAEGQVQQMSYNATFPLLLNIADRPTYFLSLKDAAGLVKMYAFVDVQQYQIVGTGSTVADAQTPTSRRSPTMTRSRSTRAPSPKAASCPRSTGRSRPSNPWSSTATRGTTSSSPVIRRSTSRAFRPTRTCRFWGRGHGCR